MRRFAFEELIVQQLLRNSLISSWSQVQSLSAPLWVLSFGWVPLCAVAQLVEHDSPAANATSLLFLLFVVGVSFIENVYKDSSFILFQK